MNSKQKHTHTHMARPRAYVCIEWIECDDGTEISVDAKFRKQNQNLITCAGCHRKMSFCHISLYKLLVLHLD